MKVHPVLTVIQGQKQAESRRTDRKEEVTSFGAELTSAMTDTRDVIEIVSLENKRALNQTPPRDLGAAEAVLAQVKSGLGQISRSELSRIHHLEGLVHFYTP
jgi:hypothetical protein